jgi:hypothetical protein
MRGRSWNEPRIPMFCWDINNVKAVFERTGFELELHHVPGCVEPFWENYLFVGRKTSAQTENSAPGALQGSA